MANYRLERQDDGTSRLVGCLRQSYGSQDEALAARKIGWEDNGCPPEKLPGVTRCDQCNGGWHIDSNARHYTSPMPTGKRNARPGRSSSKRLAPGGRGGSRSGRSGW